MVRILLLTVAAVLVARAQAQKCDPQRTRYAELNRSLIIQNKADAERYPKIKEAATQQLRTLLEQQISQQLNSDTFPQLPNILGRVRCLQSFLPQYRSNPEITNAPTAFLVRTPEPAVAVAYEIYRGGAGAPDTENFLEVFRVEGSNWQLVARTGEDFSGSTFFVNQLKPGKPGEAWFLLSGKHFGDSGSRLKLNVVSFNGVKLSTVWEQSGLHGVLITELAPDHIVLSGQKNDEHGRAQEFVERYEVVPDGLKLVSRTITKSY